MGPFDFPTEIVDAKALDRTVRHLREIGVILPTFAQLTDPSTIPPDITASLDNIDPDAPRPANLFRVHWYNDDDRTGHVAVPAYLELPKQLTGVDARIVAILGQRFPLIGAHKVLAAYACMVPRLVTGQFEPERQRAIWPSTGNYCRGGVAISRILGCRGVAVLPAGMSAERFKWLEKWVTAPSDIVRTPGSESNVREIYDACATLAKDSSNVVINQFSEFGNYLVHYWCTGRAIESVFQDIRARNPEVRLVAFAAGTGSAGTLGAGDYLKDVHGAKIVASEPLECPTMLYNGYGEHRIQGIGDKHIPLIHNVMNTDLVAGVSDRGSDHLDLVFNTDAGHTYLTKRRKLDPDLVRGLATLGYSGIANIIAAIKVARSLDLTEDDVVITVATDGADLYQSDRKHVLKTDFAGAFDEVNAAEVFAEHMLGAGHDHVIELDHAERRRIFNLGYFTWVEQQGIGLGDFDRRKDQRFWRDLRSQLPVWDEMIQEVNARTGVNLPS